MICVFLFRQRLNAKSVTIPIEEFCIYFPFFNNIKSALSWKRNEQVISANSIRQNNFARNIYLFRTEYIPYYTLSDSIIQHHKFRHRKSMIIYCKKNCKFFDSILITLEGKCYLSHLVSQVIWNIETLSYINVWNFRSCARVIITQHHNLIFLIRNRA